MKVISKKILPKYYNGLIERRKTCELRKDDSDYEVGDLLVLREWDGTKYTGRFRVVQITYIMRNMEEYGLKDGYAILCFNTQILPLLLEEAILSFLKEKE